MNHETKEPKNIHPGNAQQYHLDNVKELEKNPISGMHLCFLGSSVTFGSASEETSFVEYICKRNACTYVKEAVSGTTLVDTGEDSYVQRMQNKLNTDEKFDMFICQLSTNDASRGLTLGNINAEGETIFDTGTIIGAIEFIVWYVKQTWRCPVVFYTGTRYDSELYGKMVEVLYALQKKWGIEIIDLWNDSEMHSVTDEQYRLYMADPIHPTKAGYLHWWTPKMENRLYHIAIHSDILAGDVN